MLEILMDQHTSICQLHEGENEMPNYISGVYKAIQQLKNDIKYFIWWILWLR